MSERYLNTRRYSDVADYIKGNLDFLPEKDQKPYLALVKEIDAKGEIEREHVAEVAKNFGVATWPARRALDRYLMTVGMDAEWDALQDAAKPSTSAALKRVRRATGNAPVDEAMRSGEADDLIQENMEMELELLRPQIRFTLWQSHQKNIKPLMEEAVVELEAMQKRLEKLQREAIAAPHLEQNQLLSKIELLEDRIYFGGEAVPVEVLDEEIKFDAEEGAIPANEDPTN